MHAGSVDETEDEQGIAHLVEHVTFLGSRKREGLLGTGVRSNAYTDFHHTVFHFHSPTTVAGANVSMLPSVLDALAEIAFQPEFSNERIEKERKAVLAEAQMMNTIEYRIDCQLLKYLHEENNLGCRFPIGKVEQVKTWPKDHVKAFWERWYFPANATIYLVGDMVEPEADIVRMIDQFFGQLPKAFADKATGKPILPPPAPATDAEEETTPAPAAEDLVPRERHEVRPPVQHVYGVGTGEQSIKGTAPVKVFRHPLLQQFMLSVFCKLPIQEIHSMEDLRRAFIVRLILSVFQFRMNGRYNASAPFVSIELDSSDAGREGCCVSTLTITSEPKDWEGAITVAQEEMARLQKHGITNGELERYLDALLRDSEQLSNQADSTPSIDNLDYVMESMALGHNVMDHVQSHEALGALAGSITLDEVNGVCKSLLSFSSYYGREGDLAEEWGAAPGEWTSEPTRTTSIIACVPAYMDASGEGLGGGGGMARGGGVSTGQHIDAATIDALDVDSVVDPLGDDNQDEWGPAPDGAVKFDLTAEQIQDVLARDLGHIEAKEDIDVPDSLVDQDYIDELLAERKPQFVPVKPGGIADPRSDEHGITLRRLDNGIRINYRVSENEPKGAVLRLVAGGGRSVEVPGEEGAGIGSVAVGVRTVSEAGTVGEWQREQMELFCISKLINCMIDSDEEFVIMDFHFAVQDGGMEGAFELLHQFLASPKWDPAAFERAKSMFISHYRSTDKSLERATANRIMGVMIQDDRRFRDPTPEDVETLDMEKLKTVVSRILQANNIEVSVVGDFEPQELEQCALRYLGTLPPAEAAPAWVNTAPLVLHKPEGATANQRWHQMDSDERACAFIAGPAPARWVLPEGAAENPSSLIDYVPGDVEPPVSATEYMGMMKDERAAADKIRRAHPLFRATALQLLSEIINARLFTTVRDSLGLTYDVSFDLTVFDRLQTGWYAVTVTSEPAKIDAALNASLRVLRGLRTSSITPRELQRAARTLISRHETDLKDNGYWLALLTHLQSEAVPLKTPQCLRDLVAMYEACTIEDVAGVYDLFNFTDGNVFTCIGTSGKNGPPPAPGAKAAGGQTAEEKKAALLEAFSQFMQSDDARAVMDKLRNQ